MCCGANTNNHLPSASKLQVGGSGDEAFDDFQDMETGEVVSAAAAEALARSGVGSGDAVTAAAARAIADAEKEEIRLARLAKKASFDASYDTGNMKGGRDAKAAVPGDGDDEDAAGDGGGAAVAKKKRGPAGEEKEETYYDAVKREMAERQAKTKVCLGI